MSISSHCLWPLPAVKKKKKRQRKKNIFFSVILLFSSFIPIIIGKFTQMQSWAQFIKNKNKKNSAKQKEDWQYVKKHHYDTDNITLYCDYWFTS